MKTKKILLLYSRTGGGHLAVAEAIRQEIEARSINVEVDMRDPWVEEAPAPLNKLPAWYPYLVRSKAVWQTIYDITDRKMSAALLQDAYSKYARFTMKRLFSKNYDLIVSTHFGYNAPILDYAEKHPGTPKYITVVTDYITAHRLWFDRRATLCITPSKEVQRRGLENELDLEQLPICGLPLKPAFEKPTPRAKAEAAMGWKPFNGLRILLIGGGDGMGRLATIAKTLNESSLPIELVIVAGSNKSLKQKLEAMNWNISARILGFTDQIATIMSASDIVLTKGGPTSILEATTLGTPLILYDYLPGQEEGNVLAVVTSGAGQLVTEPDQIVDTIERYVDQPELLANFKAGCASLSQAGAAKRTVDRILQELDN